MTSVIHDMHANMLRYTEQQWTDLREAYLQAAVQIATEQGWSAVGIRAAGKRVGKTGTAINRVFTETTLRQALVTRAFAAVLIALPADRQKHRDRVGACALLAAHLLAERLDAALMVQVAAQLALTATVEARLAAYVRECRVKTAGLLAGEEPSLAAIEDEQQRKAEAQRLVDGYMAGCFALVLEPQASAGHLEMVISMRDR